MTAEKQSALQTIEEKRDLVIEIADKVWEFAELSLQEFKSAKTYCDALEAEGFEVERGTAGIETAFTASYGHGRPYIGVLAEYDALSGRASVTGTQYDDFKRVGTDIKKYDILDEGSFKTIHITLKYGEDKNDKIISGIKRISKPGLRVYAGKEELPRVLGGLGIAIISTNQGVITDKKARELQVGGEVLAYIW